MASDNDEQHDGTGWGWAGIDSLYTQYMWVWLALLVLTIVEVYVPEPTIFVALFESVGLDPLAGLQENINYWYLEYAGGSRVFVVVALILMAVTKTWLVAWYYMHLISEKPAIILVACAPFLFSVFLTVGIFPWGTTFGFESPLFVPS